MYFLVLFPLGVGDPFGRRWRVPRRDGIAHLMKFADRPPPVDGVPQPPRYRFANHLTFRYWCLETKMHRQANEKDRLFLHQNEGEYRSPSTRLPRTNCGISWAGLCGMLRTSPVRTGTGSANSGI